MNTLERLQALEKPCFALFRNLPAAVDLEPAEATIRRGEAEFIAASKHFNALLRLVPEPCKLADEALVDWSWVELLIRSNRLNEGNLEPQYDTSYASRAGYWEGCEEIKDEEVFGDSYTIVWLCSYDIDQVVASAVEYYLHRNPQPGYSAGWILLDLWQTRLDRICLLDDVMENYEFFQEAETAISEALDRLPNGPSKEGWDALEKFLREGY